MKPIIKTTILKTTCGKVSSISRIGQMRRKEPQSVPPTSQNTSGSRHVSTLQKGDETRKVLFGTESDSVSIPTFKYWTVFPEAELTHRSSPS